MVLTKLTQGLDSTHSWNLAAEALNFWLFFLLPDVTGFKDWPVVKLALSLGKQTAEQDVFHVLVTVALLLCCFPPQGHTLSEIEYLMKIFSWIFSKLLFFFTEANKPSLDILMKCVILTPDFSCEVPIPSTIFQIYFHLFQDGYFCEENVI